MNDFSQCLDKGPFIMNVLIKEKGIKLFKTIKNQKFYDP